MAASISEPHARQVPGLTTTEVRWTRPALAVPLVIAAAWSVLFVAEATGAAAALHHHALIEGGLPLAMAVPLFLLGWTVMVAAMMLPASLPTIRTFDAASAWLARPRRARLAFLVSFVAVWTAFGLMAFMGDVGLHHLVDATPWLAARPQLIEAGILALAGGYQLLPIRQQRLAACRHQSEPPTAATLGKGASVGSRLGPVGASAGFGLGHGLACLGSSWALMLLMFAEGFANLSWMVALTAVMVYETSGRHGPRVGQAVGVVLILAALAVLSGASIARL